MPGEWLDFTGRDSGSGNGLFQLYKISCCTTYFDDLAAPRFENVSELARDIHRWRNDFAHGKLHAIDDGTVHKLVEHLKDEHE